MRGWSQDSALAAVEQLPPSVLLGAGIAVLVGMLGALARALFVDDVRMRHREAPGPGLRALGHGPLAGLAGGAVVTAVPVAVSYRFFWWVLGALTLLPVTGSVPQWDAAAITAASSALVGHLGYGAALGAVHYRLVARADPWWINRSVAEAERVGARRTQTLGSAPALGELTVLIALTVPLLVVG